MDQQTIQMVEALSTPLVAAIAASISYQQYRSNKYKLKMDLFEKRYAVYKSFMELVDRVMLKQQLDLTEEIVFNTLFYETIFLFGEDIILFLQETQKQLIAFASVTRKVDEFERRAKMGALSEQEKRESERIAAESQRLRADLKKTIPDIPAKFSKYLTLGNVL